MIRALGIDIGGTKITIAALDNAGHIAARTTFETRSTRGFEVCLAELLEHIRRVLTVAHWSVHTISGVGIGCTGPVDPQRGTIHNPYTLPGWDGADIVSPLRNTLAVPVYLENDADTAALGEFQFGAGRGTNPLVMITLGTGIGGAALTDGRIYRGMNGEHPELGHIPVALDGAPCYCGISGCWESIASGTAIAAAGQAIGLADSRAVFGASKTDPRAAAIIQRAVCATARAAWTIIHTFLPQRIILGGGIGEQHFSVFHEAIRAQISTATQVSGHRVEITPAQLGNDAGVIGAACLAFSSPLKVDSPAAM